MKILNEQWSRLLATVGLMAISFLLVQCGRESQDTGVLPAPTAAFTAIPTTQNPLRVSFSNASDQARTYFWDFGDSTGTSQEATPTYTYRRAGTYRVRLVASGDGGAANVVQAVTVTAPPAPVASFTLTVNDATAPLRVNFTNTSTNGVSYSWDFGVPNVASDTSNAASPGFDYPQSGLYTVTLTARSVANILTNVRTLSVLVIRPSDLATTTGRTWIYDRTKGISFDNGSTFSEQKTCELGTEFTFFPDGRYVVDNKGSEIRFPDCAAVPARPASTWQLTRTAADRFTLTLGAGTFFGDPTTGPTYTITNLTPSRIDATAALSFGPAVYQMVSK